MNSDEIKLSITTGRAISVYIASIILGIAAALVADLYFGLSGHRVIHFYIGVLFLLASIKRPGLLFETIRRTGRFSRIKNDKTLQIIMAVVGVLLCILSLVLPAEFINELSRGN